MGQHVGAGVLSGGAVQFLPQPEPDRAVSPALYTADRARIRMVTQIGVVGQNQACPAVGHLAAVEASQPALGNRVGRIVVRDGVGDGPVARLRVGIAPCVGEVQLRNGPQMCVVQTIAPVVFVSHLREHRRPQVACANPLVTRPRGRAQVLGGGITGDRLLQLDTHLKRGVVCAGPQVGHRRERRHAAGGARGFVPRGRGVPKPVANRGRHRPEVALAGEHFTEGVGDVDDPDFGCVHLGRGERALDNLASQSREVAVFFGQIAREIALVATQNPHTCRTIHTPHGTPG